MTPYPKRLIEVDLPIKKISAHARREKSIRHGHISTLHIWWARRPLAACRAVICAALWPDPMDEHCPQAFRDAAATILADFAEQVRTDAEVAGLVSDHWQRWRRTNVATFHPADDFAVWPDMRAALLDFIADFANWDASTVPAFLNTARALTQAAHEALGGLPGTRPLVVDPFAGGGSIPLEALRVGADAFASDLNPVAVLLNKVVLEYIPKYGQQLADEVRKWGQWIEEQAEKELAEFYPRDPNGATPIAYLWARTIISEAPNDGSGIPVEVPLMRSMWLAKKSNRGVALRWQRDAKGQAQTETVEVTYANGVTRTVRRPLLEIFEPKKAGEVEEGTIARGSVTCPVTGYTTPVASVRRQLKERRGGATDARVFAVVTTRLGQQGRFYRLPMEQDWAAAQKAAAELEGRKQTHTGLLALVPDEPLSKARVTGNSGFRVLLYGMEFWEELFTPRQAITLTILTRLVREVGEKLQTEQNLSDGLAVQTCLALAVDRVAAQYTSLSWWQSNGEFCVGTFGRQALPIVWDFCEIHPTGGGSGDLDGAIEWVRRVIDTNTPLQNVGHVESASATHHPLPNDSIQVFFTDPPYYDAVAYADLSDFFFVWLKRMVGDKYEGLFTSQVSPKDDECIVDWAKGKDKIYFETTMARAMAEGQRIIVPNGVGVVVFAHKSTSGWEAQLQGMIDGGWIITGSWPIDTERSVRMVARDAAALASSVHLICRPRETEDGSLSPAIGDWRDVLQELPQRIHAWLPRLAREGVVGADAIFACLGPALEIFSRYSRVEKASGEQVLLKEYLEQVWAAVSKEALSMVFAGADATGFEEDARLTAMWLWTLNTGRGAGDGGPGPEEETVEEDESGTSKKPMGGFSLEYDAARKIAQGLGAHLERLGSLVEVKGETAQLLPVSTRAGYLFSKDALVSQAPARPKKRSAQLSMFDSPTEEEAAAEAWGDMSGFEVGHTMLDRVHQSMLLFAAGRSDALKRFLVEEGVGRDSRYWALANALSALYPPGTNEKRWVEGVLARKKGLGF